MAVFGLLFAFMTLIAWTVGDFYIQRASRAIGTWKSLFAISIIGTIVPAPFLVPQIEALVFDAQGLVLLSALSAVLLVAALFEIEALKRGKLAIIEPVFGLEIPLTLLLSVGLGVDHIRSYQALLIFLVVIGVLMTVFTLHVRRFSHLVLERGIVLAGLGVVAMALSVFLTGVGSRATDPFVTIWFVNAVLSVASFLVIVLQPGPVAWHEFFRFRRLVLNESIFDNIAWFSFAIALTLIPISVATAIADSYIAFSVVLGVQLNRERVAVHQFAGVAIVIIGVVLLSLTLSS